MSVENKETKQWMNSRMLLKNLKIRKLAGKDGMHAEMIKEEGTVSWCCHQNWKCKKEWSNGKGYLFIISFFLIRNELTLGSRPTIRKLKDVGKKGVNKILKNSWKDPRWGRPCVCMCMCVCACFAAVLGVGGHMKATRNKILQ